MTRRSSGALADARAAVAQAKAPEKACCWPRNCVPERPRQLRVVAVADAEAAVAADDADLGELVRGADGQAAQADGLDQLEDGGVGADAERQREQHGQREGRVLAAGARTA